jgi:aminoglycoside-2''-adenylyltransferase
MAMHSLALRHALTRMNGYALAWAVAGGWAIDLFVGRETRPHADVDLATLRIDQAALFVHLAAASLTRAHGGTLREWRAGETLELPVHEVHATWPDGSSIEILLNEVDADNNWVFRRDARIRLPFSRAFVHRDAIPFLAPEVVLLYKSNDLSAKNHADLVTAANLMSAHQVRWLRDAITLHAPDHPWLGHLGAGA